MQGTIIGDIAGSAYEFCTPPVKTKNFIWFGPNAHITDDTVTTIAVAAALMEGKREPGSYTDQLRRKLRYWCRQYPNAGFGSAFFTWFQSDHMEPYGSYGNGAAMRVSPAAWVGSTLDEVQELAELTAVVTHDHPEAVKGAVAVASVIYLARTGSNKEAIARYIRQYFYPLAETLADIRKTYTFTCRTGDSVPQAIEAFLESCDFADAIAGAVSLGGDTDTQAAIAGAVGEAYYGVPASLWQQAQPYVPQPLHTVLQSFMHQYMNTCSLRG